MKPGYLCEKLKTWRALTTIELNNVGIVLFYLDLELLNKKCKKPGFFDCVETRSLLIFANDSRSRQNKKSPLFFKKTKIK